MLSKSSTDPCTEPRPFPERTDGARAIDLIWLGETPPRGAWPLGEMLTARPTPLSVQERIEQWIESAGTAELCLFWSAELGEPDPEIVLQISRKPGDLWHAGLRLGMAGRPAMMDFVNPTWMLNRDPDPALEATSWRLSLRACLLRGSVLRHLGGLSPGFETLEGASLELGHRGISSGVISRHVPALVRAAVEIGAPAIPVEDELRFLLYRFGRSWAAWALFRSLLSGAAPPKTLRRGWRKLGGARRPVPAPPFRPPAGRSPDSAPSGTVSIIIPTLDRSAHLRTLLDQLRRQTHPPIEILVVDQTPRERRDLGLAEDFGDLPLRIFYLDEPGQCSSRNLAIERSRGEFLLFLDDDDEVPPSLIRDHLENLRERRALVSSGVAEETGMGPLPHPFTYHRVSDVFPTNNTMLHRSVLLGSGLFDLAYERGPRADGDLGMRVYLSGQLMVLSPEICVIHRHAPRGGLRVHRARVITYASSRSRLLHRHLPSATEVYLARRYFRAAQVREMLWLRAAGTFRVRGGALRKILKLLTGAILLPSTVSHIRRVDAEAERMLLTFPRIPDFKDGIVP